MRKLVLFITIMLMPTVVLAAPYRSTTNAKSSTGVKDIAVATTSTVFTQSVDIKENETGLDNGIYYKASSSGVVNLRIDLQESFEPSTDGAADADYQTSAIVTTSLTDKTWHLATIDTVLPNIRFKVIGQGSNDATTTVEIKVSR